MKINHRRRNPPRYPAEPLRNGYRPLKPWGYLDKSLHGWGNQSLFADVQIGAGIGNDFSNGHRGMAHAVRGAKKFVRSRIRAADKITLKRMVHTDG